MRKMAQWPRLDFAYHSAMSWQCRYSSFPRSLSPQASGREQESGVATARVRSPAAPVDRWNAVWRLLVALLLGVGLAAPALAAPTAEEQAAITQINVRRAQVGLPALTYNANLEQAARGHANYLAVNDATGHFQSTTGAGFTGITPLDRIVASLFGTPAVSTEVISFGPSTGVAAIDSLIQAIYHRFGIFSSRLDQTGVGVVTNHPTYGSVFVVDSAVLFLPPPSLGMRIGVYPYNGQGASGQDPVPRSFLSDTESPDPVPSTNKVGYPISIHVDDDKTLAVTTFTVKPVGGSTLPAQLLAPGDPNVPLSAAALIPTAPLEYGTTYEVQFSGTANVTTPVTQTWQFTTAPLLPITFSPAQPYLAWNSSLNIDISGGSGVYVGASYIGPANVIVVGPSTLMVTSLASTGPVTIEVTDDEGQTGTVTVQIQPTVDSMPDAFSFPAVTGAAVSTIVQSAQITVSGISAPAAIGVAGGEYSINGGAFTSQPGTVVNGNTVRVRLTSAPIGSTTTSAALTIGGVSALFSVTTLDNSVPSVPAGLAISNLGANSLTVFWTAAGDNIGVTAYRVFRGGVFRASVTGFTLSFNDSGLTPATAYSYTVSACDAAGNCSAQSQSVSATTLDNLPPLAPTGLGITNLAANSLTLNWSAATDNVAVIAYRVFRGGVFHATVLAPTLSLDDSGLAAATSYSYTVSACDAALNCSAQSATVSATTPDNVPPSTPVGLGIINVAANTLTLNWLASSDNVAVTAYQVYRGGVFRATVAAPSVSFNDSGLTSVTLYSYTVRACDAAGNCSAPSAAISATTADNVPPSTPVGLMATPVSGTQINLAWASATDNVGVTAYEVYRGGVFRATVNAPGTGFSDTSLVNGTTYSYTVRACDAAGNCSAQSAAASATTPDTQAPSVPAGLTATAVSQNQINVAWTTATDNVAVTTYRVFRGGVFRATVNAPTVAFGDAGLTAGTAYSYTVAACDAAGNCSAQSAAVAATTLTPGQYAFTQSLEAGFNQIGNALDATLDVTAAFGNADAPVALVTSNTLSIWKWNAVDGRWAFYSPQLTAAGIAAYAAAHNYDVLSVINPGEGYWVNATGPITLPMQSGAGFTWNGFNFAALPSGFNLIAAADSYTPSQFNNVVSSTSPAPGVVPTDNFFTLWAWDTLASTWYFYSPLLEASGGLSAVKAYADSKFFRHFQDYAKSIGAGAGFWVNRP